MRKITLDESFFEGAVSFEKKDGLLRPWRLPFDLRRLFPPDNTLPVPAGKCSGVRLRFETDSAAVALEVAPGEGARRFDLTVGGELVGSEELPAGANEVGFEKLPAGQKVVELWLPPGHEVRVAALSLDDGASCEVVADPRPKWVTYGSSITHCSGAHGPARTWPAVAARLKGLNLTCLGYGGNCHLEPSVALMIRDLPAEVISLKIGINIYGASSLSPRTFRPALIGFVRLLREKHPTTPLAVVTSIVSPPRETVKNAVGFTLQEMRGEVEDAVKRLRDCGDENIRCFSGLELFGADLVADYLPDELHPNGDGYELLGRRFAEQVLSRYDF